MCNGGNDVIIWKLQSATPKVLYLSFQSSAGRHGGQPNQTTDKLFICKKRGKKKKKFSTQL